MKIAISAAGPNLDDMVDPRFRRCAFFHIFDIESEEHESFKNESASAGGGAGISSAQGIVDKGVTAVLTGNCGPNAFQVLSAAGVQMIVGVNGKVREAIEQFKAGTLKHVSSPNVADHFGSGSGSGGGMGGGGMGRR